MPEVTLVARAGAIDPDRAYRTLAEFERYSEHTDAVRSVEIFQDGNTTMSTWEVEFRRGLLRWTEEDSFDPVKRRLAFRQVTGDFARFDGAWEVDEDGDGGSLVRFTASFDLGIPALADILDPVAQRTLYVNIASIVRGLLGEDVEIVAPEQGVVPSGSAYERG